MGIKRVKSQRASRDANKGLPLSEVFLGTKQRAGGGHGEKLRYDLLPFSALDEAVKVFQHGNDKYPMIDGVANWRVGLDHSAHLAAVLRHVSQMFQGEEYDQESGVYHAAHAIARLLMYLESRKECLGTEDIFKGDT